MTTEKVSSGERDYLGKALDIAVRLSIIALIVFASFKIFSPFIVAVVWGMVIAIALNPIFTKMRDVLGGRNKLAGALFIVISLALVIGPTVLLTNSLLDGTVRIVKKAEAGTLEIPPPTEKVKEWPLIGEKAYAVWQSASVDLKKTTDKLQPQLKNLGHKILSTVAGLGRSFVQTIFALIIAGILMMTSQGADRTARSVAVRIAGPEDGPAIVDIATGTIRSVVKGVILVALIQSVLAAIGLQIAGVPAVGLWALLVMVVAVIQLPPILILGPIIPWVFANNDSTAIAVFFLIWSLVVSGSDSFLKPMFLGRGVKVPMLVILVGAIGGMLRSGVVGLFIGPVFLAIAYQLFTAWVRDDEAPGLREDPETAES
ncbi:MAG: AI-2E family transporter [Candidatus Krumholzibacteriota bacterium]|nr:AI-2E family transporter [Candidatus Krumholzibacteriota bacterium]